MYSGCSTRNLQMTNDYYLMSILRINGALSAPLCHYIHTMVFRHIRPCHGAVVEFSRRYWLRVQISAKKDDIDFPLHVLAYDVAHPRTRGQDSII